MYLALFGREVLSVLVLFDHFVNGMALRMEDTMLNGPLGSISDSKAI